MPDDVRRDARGRARCAGCGGAFEPTCPGQRCCRPSCVRLVEHRVHARRPLLALADEPEAPEAPSPRPTLTLTLDDLPF